MASFRTGETLSQSALDGYIPDILRSVLRRIGGINDNGILRLVIDNEVGIVVARALPYNAALAHTPKSIKHLRLTLTSIATSPLIISHHQFLPDLHMGIDWICMARERAGYQQTR